MYTLDRNHALVVYRAQPHFSKLSPLLSWHRRYILIPVKFSIILFLFFPVRVLFNSTPEHIIV